MSIEIGADATPKMLLQAVSGHGGKITWLNGEPDEDIKIALEEVSIDEDDAVRAVRAEGYEFLWDGEDGSTAIDAAGLADFVTAVASHDVITAQALAARLFEHDSEVLAIDTALRQLLSPGYAHRRAA